MNAYEQMRSHLVAIHDEIKKYLAKEINDISLCLRIKNIVNEALAEQKYEAKWKLGGEYEYAYCSHCGHQQWASWNSYREARENIGEFHKQYKFCPNCGFEMKGANE